MNKILILTILLLISIQAKKIEAEKKDILVLMYNKLGVTSKIYNEKESHCNQLENERIISPELFKNLSFEYKQISKSLGHFYIKSKHECIKNEENNVLIAQIELLNVLSYYKDDKALNERKEFYKMFFYIVPLLKSEKRYNNSLDKKTRDYLNSLNELKQPFNYNKTLLLLKNSLNN